MNEWRRKVELERGVHHFFDGYEPMFLVTLNSNVPVPRLSEMDAAVSGMNRQVAVLVRWLKEYCFSERSQRCVKGVGFFERMPDSNILHCHLVLATRDRTRRTFDQVKLKVESKWKRFLNIDSTQTVEAPTLSATPSEKLRKWVSKASRRTDVRKIYDMPGLVRYCNKDFLKHELANQFCVGFYEN